MMQNCAIQQTATGSSRENLQNTFPVMVTDRRETVICPKPRRLSLLNSSFNDHPFRSFRWQISHQTELCDSKAGSDILDMILTKDGCRMEQVASSPPFFCGSPPSRVANPLIQDPRFGEEKVLTPLSQSSPNPPPSPASSSRKVGCIRANFGNNPAVRVEGFDCLDKDRRHCSIPALA